MAYVDFISKIHKSTPRDYLKRVLEHDKAQCAEVAVKFGKDYWDGERQYGYGGYRYDGRWRPVADASVISRRWVPLQPPTFGSQRAMGLSMAGKYPIRRTFPQLPHL